MRISAISKWIYLIALKSSCMHAGHIVIGVCFWPWNAARRWRNANSWLGDFEMLLEDGETRTRGYKNLKMLLEDGETRTRGCNNLEIKNFIYPTPSRRPRLDFRRFGEPAFLAAHYPRPPCAPNFIKSRTFRILPTHFFLFWNSLYVYTRGILGCLLGFWPLGQNPAGAIKTYMINLFQSSYPIVWDVRPL